MSTGSPKLARRNEAIEAARRRLRRLEIETHRIKAELARLEAEYEDDVADRMTRRLRRRTPSIAQPSDQSHDTAVDLAPNSSGPTVLRFERGVPTVAGVCDSGPRTNSRRAAVADGPKPALPQINLDAASSSTRPPQATSYRKAASPLLVSGAAHIAVLLFCVTITVATIAQQEVELFASPVDLNEDVTPISEVEITDDKFDDPVLQNALAETPDFNIADNMANQFEPAQLGAGSQSLGDVGQLDALPSDLGTLMAGAGQPGAGKLGGEPGEAIFFGARSKGDRFVFVVDNSSSMKGPIADNELRAS
jgi:hypothetical protein